jgi:hypothetical protein
MSDDSKSEDAVDTGSQFAEVTEVLGEVQYEPTSDRAFTAVVAQTIATYTEKDMESLRDTPLYNHVNIGAIETLLFGLPPNQSTGPATQKVTFRYCTVLVTIHADGIIQVADIDAPTT